MLGQWLSIKEGLNRPLVYQIFQYFLDKNDVLNDLVVRVTAGRQLKNVIDPFEWTPQSFMPYAPTLLSRLMMLIEEVELSETKMALLNTVTTIVVRMEQHVKFYVLGSVASVLLNDYRSTLLRTRSSLSFPFFGPKLAMSIS